MKLKKVLLVVLAGGLLFFIPALPTSAVGPHFLDPAGNTQCTDHLDNDSDGTRDYSGVADVPADPDCTGPEDNSEAATTTPPTNGGGTTPTNNTSSSDSTATNDNTNTSTNTSTNTNENTSSSGSTSSGTSSSGSASGSCVALCDSDLL